MTVERELNRHALTEHRDLERRTLERVEAEANALEVLPEGEEARSVVIDGYLVPQPRRRIRGRLSVRW